MLTRIRNALLAVMVCGCVAGCGSAALEPASRESSDTLSAATIAATHTTTPLSTPTATAPDEPTPTEHLHSVGRTFPTPQPGAIKVPVLGLPPVPLYPDAHNVVTHEGEDVNSQVTITIFETDDLAEEVYAFYQQALEAQGWKVPQIELDGWFEYSYSRPDDGTPAETIHGHGVTSFRAWYADAGKGSIRVTIRIDAWNLG